MVVMNWYSIIAPIVVLVLTAFYTVFLLLEAKNMKNNAKLLREEIKGKLAISFLQESVDFLTQSEFAELMREVSLVPNLKQINKESLIGNVYERTPKIEKELKKLMNEISLANKLDKLVKSLEKWARVLVITVILLDSSILFLVLYPFIFFYSPLLKYMSLVVIFGFFLAIVMALKVNSNTDKYKDLYNKRNMLMAD